MKLVSFLLLTALSACGQNASRTVASAAQDCRTLPSLAINDATEDAASAYKNNDHRLIGVYGYATESPGVEMPTLPLRMIEGTSDSDCVEENKAIRSYAVIYNRELVRLLAKP